MPPPRASFNFASIALLLAALAAPAAAEDWPEWRGKGRLGVWTEDGILDKFPESGLKFLWRTPIHAGYSGPSVSQGRVFITDFQATTHPRGIERAVCLEESTGKILWTIDWEVNYGALSYNDGPRATPTVDGDRVYTLGALGMLQCIDVKTGKALWKVDYMKDLGAELPVWGMTAAPIVEGNLLICLAAAEPGGKVIAFDKLTGKEAWRALSSDFPPGYVQPIIIDAGGARQLIVWHPHAVSSLNPATGAVYWEQPFKIKMDAPLAQPVAAQVGGKPALFVTAFYNGPMMLGLDESKPAASIIWKGTSDNEIKTDGLHACHVVPFIKDGYIYGVCSYGQFRCLDAATGQRKWETFDITMENQRWASAFIVPNGDRYFFNNDRGELIIGKLSPEGYEEISRAELIKPTTGGAVGRRERGGVNWSHPAYANRRIYCRNDEEILCASLEK